MTVDFDTLSQFAEVLDTDEVDELAKARKPSGAPSQYVEWFLNEQGGDSVFLPVEALGERRIKDNGTAPHDEKSVQTLAGNIRKYARLNEVEVNATARKRAGQLGILFERREPDYSPGRGRKPAAAEAE